MKKTININLGGLVFKIDDDAYDRLNLYIETLKNKFHNIEERNEIIQDIEYRFAELFSEDLNKTQEVVTIKMVSNAVSTMGAPEEIEEDEDLNISENHFQETNSNNSKVAKKLFRDPDNRVFAGVISGVSKYLGLSDPVWLRIAMVLLFISVVGFPIILIYALMWIVTPYAKTASEKLQMSGDSINLENIENQVKKNINSEAIKRNTALISDKVSEIAPILLKVIGLGLILFFCFQLITATVALFGGGLLLSNFNSDYLNLLFDANSSYYLGLISLYALIATPLILAIYLAIKIFTKGKVNWILSFLIALFLMIIAFIGIGTSAYSVTKGFKAEAEQTNFVALENPTMNELNIEFPYEKFKDNLNMNIQFGDDNDNDFDIDGFKVFPGKKEVHINAVSLEIVPNRTDTLFKLSKTVSSRGRSQEDAEEKLTHINNAFEYLMENTIAIPRKIILTDETKWRMQLIDYTLEMPIGKRVYFGEHAKKVIENVSFNGDYSRKYLANNTWEMTKQGLKCVTCEED
jgi:phage shock protein PspC (stress-responsive transcriptional regulator)